MSAISKRYARALVNLGAERKTVERFGEELGKVNAAFASQTPLRLLMESPSFSPQKKRAMLIDLAGALDLSEGMRNFLGLLLQKDRLSFLPQIETDYREFADELSGTLRAKVTAACELAPAEKKSIRAALEKQTGKKVELNAEVDPALIGGLQVAIGGRLFDGSLKTQLRRIEDTLKKG